LGVFPGIHLSPIVVKVYIVDTVLQVTLVEYGLKDIGRHWSFSPCLMQRTYRSVAKAGFLHTNYMWH